MQRVSMELYAALGAHPDIQLSSFLLRASWRAIHVRVVPFWLRLLWEIPSLVRQERIEVVLFYSMVTGSLAVPLRRRMEEAGVRMVAIANGKDVTLPVAAYQWYLPHVFGALDGVIPISHATGAECIRRGLEPEKLRVIPCGVDPQRFSPPPDRSLARRALLAVVDGAALPPDALLLCSVGRLVKRKGFAWFVDQVMPLLPSNVHYWLAGIGPRREAIEEAITRQGLEARVRLLGKVSEELLIKLYRGADLFIMPNRPVEGDMEGFGVVMLEAGVSGLPTVAADLEGIGDVIREGENGHLVTSGDAAGFMEAILRYYRDSAALSALSARSASYTASHFAWPGVVDQYVEFLHTLTARTLPASTGSGS